MKTPTRSYRLQQRAESQTQTRQQIIDAAIQLHQSKGVAATSMADIAALAKVGKATVYRHFPDEMVLAQACSGHYFQQHPFPDPEAWQAIEDPAARLRHGLTAIYAYHRETSPMLAKVYAEAKDLPIMAPYHAHWQRAADILAVAWPDAGETKRLLTVGIALALNFETWQLLTAKQGLTDEQAVDLMVRLACDC